MLKLLAIALMLSSSLLLPSQALAKEVTEREQLAECELILNEAAEALNNADIAINKQADTIEAYDFQVQRLEKALDRQLAETASARASADAWYRQPSVVAPLAAILGFMAGAYVMKRVQQ